MPVPQEPRQLSSATQPIPISDAIGPRTVDIPVEGYELLHDGQIFSPFRTEPVLARRVGANWPPSAYDPRSQALFVCANYRTFFYSVDTDETDDPATGTRYMGGSFGTAELPPFGLLVAMDMTTNRVVWRQRWADRCFSGVTVTAGDLLFVGRNDGRLTALDSRDGKRLWEFQTGAGAENGANLRAASFAGRQEIARVIRDGRDQMPAFGTMLTDDQVLAVASYVLELVTR